MAEPLKNMFSRQLLEPFASEVKQVWPSFPTADFLKNLFNEEWEGLELKQRMRRISDVLRRHLPESYPEALHIIVGVTRRYLDRLGDSLTFVYAFLPDFVEAHGVEHPDESIPALETITRLSSAEFAVRPFLLRYPERMYAQMLAWARHDSPMVRRLATEGIRPRLPWGAGVPALKRDPAPVLPILEILKNDPAETVRRSVANNLNDIAKDHPGLALELAGRWLGQSPEVDWVVRHGCRGLLKKGNPDALAYFGFDHSVQGIELGDWKHEPRATIGGRLSFSFTAHNTSAEPQRVRLEYGIDFLTSTGKYANKVFRIREMDLEPGQTETFERHQSFRDLTIRKHYPGTHRIRILLNGKPALESHFVLD